MDTARLEIAGEKLFVWALIFLGAIVAILTGFLIGTDAVPIFIVILAIALSITWLAGARERWWLLVPAAGTLGGYFYFGYKIYPHEIALLACFVPLAMAFAVRAPIAQLRTTAFPITMYLLGFYLIVHWFGSNIYNWVEGTAGYGNVSRAYFNAVWVILFLFAFWRWGSTKYIAAALLLSYLAAFARVTMGVLLYYFTDIFAYVPVINYVLPGSTYSRSDDLRWSGISLATLAICYFLMKKGLLRKTFHAIVFLGSCVALVLGSGRTVVVLAGAMPLFVVLLYRKLVPLIVTSIALVGLVFIVNSDPSVLNPLPFRVQRSLSVLLLKKGEATHYGKTEASDRWHEDLRKLGYSKWTQSWQTVLFGTGIRPFDFSLQEVRPGITINMENLMDSAAKVGSYESGWWTVIAVTGVVGLMLYASVLFYLLRKLLPILLRERVSDHSHAFAFMAVFGIVIWIGLGWTNGGFPTTEIMFGFLALAALEDRRRKTQPEHLSITRQPVEHPSLAAT